MRRNVNCLFWHILVVKIDGVSGGMKKYLLDYPRRVHCGLSALQFVEKCLQRAQKLAGKSSNCSLTKVHWKLSKFQSALDNANNKFQSNVKLSSRISVDFRKRCAPSKQAAQWTRLGNSKKVFNQNFVYISKIESEFNGKSLPWQ